VRGNGAQAARRAAGRGRARERAVEWALATAAGISGAAVLAILLFLLLFCIPVFTGRADVWSWEWRPFHGHYGILPMVVASLLLSTASLALAFPTALGICAFVHGVGPRRLARVVLGVVQLMTGIPTIVYAFVSAMILVPILRGLFARGSGYSLLAATLVLSVLILPTIVLLIHARWESAAPAVRRTCAGLGFTPSQTILRVLVPITRRGLLVVAIMGFARAVGDTMIALLLSGNAAQVPRSPLDAVRTLTAHVALVHATDSQDAAYTSIFAAGLLLLLMTGALSAAARGLRASETTRGSRAGRS
jgi:phosphate transport system permease protein